MTSKAASVFMNLHHSEEKGLNEIGTSLSLVSKFGLSTSNTHFMEGHHKKDPELILRRGLRLLGNRGRAVQIIRTGQLPTPVQNPAKSERNDVIKSSQKAEDRSAARYFNGRNQAFRSTKKNDRPTFAHQQPTIDASV